MTDKIVVFSTCGSQEEAMRVGRALLEARVAACVNIVPGIHSLYRWHGNIEESKEWLLVIKTRRDLLDRLGIELRNAHSYEVPEMIALAIVDGLPAYLDWIDGETAGP
jgi:periplasmic divalent cation tolerance protein